MNLGEQLNHIAATIKKGGYDSSEMVERLDEAIQETREITFKYQAQSVFPELVEHLKTYKSFGKRNKSVLIATLEDIQRHLKSKNTNDKVVLSLLNQITESNYCTDRLQNQMMLGVLISRKTTFQTEYVEVV